MLTGIVVLINLSNNAFAQQKTQDTLIINSKAGKIILVSDSLQKFNGINSELLIRKSLASVGDSLSETKEARAKRLWKERFTWILPNKSPLRILPGAGIGTIRDKFSPSLALSLDFSPQRQDYYRKSGGSYTFLNLAVNGFFTFEKDASNQYITNHNIFIEYSMGNRVNNFYNNFGTFSEAAVGIGYLAYKQGGYFERNTFKFFAQIGLHKSFIKLKPELYFTDNFSKIFPGITFKFF